MLVRLVEVLSSARVHQVACYYSNSLHFSLTFS